MAAECISELGVLSSPTQLENYLNKYANTDSITSLKSCTSLDVLCKQLDVVSNNEALASNAKIRRRIKRFIESLTYVEPPVIAKATQAKNENGYKVKSGKEASVSATYNSPIDFNLNDVINNLDSAFNVRSIEQNINRIDFNQVIDINDKNQLKNVLVRVLNHKEQFTNKLIRKRINKLIFSLSTKEEQEKQKIEHKATANSNSNNENAKRKNEFSSSNSNDKRQKVDRNNDSNSSSKYAIDRTRSDAKQIVPDPASFESCLRRVYNCEKNGSNITEIESAFGDVSNMSTGDRATKEKLLVKINGILASTVLKVTHGLKRKLTRLSLFLTDNINNTVDDANAVVTVISTPTAATTAVTTAATASAAVTKRCLKIPPIAPSSASSGIDVQISQCTSADALEALVGSILPTDTYDIETNKRIIHALEAASLIDSIMNAKVRRKIKRAIISLETGNNNTTNTYDKKIESDATAAVDAAEGGAETDGRPVSVAPPILKNPCIVFVGQLTYTTTASDLMEFFRSNGIEGDINIRMLHDKDTKASKGQCFVELEGPREMNKCLALHQKTLDNRRINVEKSVGGRNKSTRIQKIKESKLQVQIKKSEEIDKIIDVYVNDFKLPRIKSDILLNKMYRLPENEVRIILKKFCNMPDAMRSKMSILDKLIVDQLATKPKAAK